MMITEDNLYNGLYSVETPIEERIRRIKSVYHDNEYSHKNYDPILNKLRNQLRKQKLKKLE